MEGDLRRSLENIYFFLLHEPTGLEGIDGLRVVTRGNKRETDYVVEHYRSITKPVVPMPEAIRHRLENGFILPIMRRKILADFFGQTQYAIIDHLEEFYTKIMNHQNELLEEAEKLRIRKLYL